MKVLLINTRGLLGDGLMLLIKQHDLESECAAVFGHAEVRQHAARDDYDLAIFDLDAENGSDCAKTLGTVLADNVTFPTIVLTNSTSKSVARLLLERGVCQVVSKSAGHEKLLDAMSAVLAGHGFGSNKRSSVQHADPLEPPCESSIRDRIQNSPRLFNPRVLTPRQMDVLKELAKGKSNKNIAHDLAVSENTVRNHLSAVFRALHARNRTEALCHATELQLVTVTSKKFEPCCYSPN